MEITTNEIETNNNQVFNGESKFLALQTRIPQLKKFFDGPAYTLAPISQIAPLYVKACLIKRQKDI